MFVLTIEQMSTILNRFCHWIPFIAGRVGPVIPIMIRSCELAA
jgi:hypothetical protein